jgi:hypothetical protein
MVAGAFEARAQSQKEALQAELNSLQAAINDFNARCTGVGSRSNAALYNQCAAEKARLSQWQDDLMRRAKQANGQ